MTNSILLLGRATILLLSNMYESLKNHVKQLIRIVKSSSQMNGFVKMYLLHQLQRFFGITRPIIDKWELCHTFLLMCYRTKPRFPTCATLVILRRHHVLIRRSIWTTISFSLCCVSPAMIFREWSRCCSGPSGIQRCKIISKIHRLSSPHWFLYLTCPLLVGISTLDLFTCIYCTLARYFRKDFDGSSWKGSIFIWTIEIQWPWSDA